MIGEKSLNSGTPVTHNVILLDVHIFEYEETNLKKSYDIYNTNFFLCLDRTYLLQRLPSSDPTGG